MERIVRGMAMILLWSVAARNVIICSAALTHNMQINAEIVRTEIVRVIADNIKSTLWRALYSLNIAILCFL